MTKEDIIELAKQSGWDEHHAKFDLRIEKFAKLVAKRTWVGLTDDEIWEAYMKAPLTLDCSTDELYAISRTVEAKLKERNT